MIIDLLKEVYYLTKFKYAVEHSDLISAATYLELHKTHSDAVEAKCSTILSGSKDKLIKQQETLNSLIDGI